LASRTDRATLTWSSIRCKNLHRCDVSQFCR